MNESPSSPRPLEERAHGTPGGLVIYDDREELAFELWAFKHARNIHRVAKETGIPDTTLRRWSRDHEWDRQLAERFTAIAPNVDAGYVVDTIQARGHAMSRLNMFLNPDNDHEMSKLEVVAAVEVLKHATVVAPTGLAGAVRTGGLIAADDAPSSEQFDAMSPEEVKEWADNRFKRWR